VSTSGERLFAKKEKLFTVLMNNSQSNTNQGADFVLNFALHVCACALVTGNLTLEGFC